MRKPGVRITGVDFIRSLKPAAECIDWPFFKQRGYGKACYQGKSMGAYRLSCIIHNGPPPSPELEAAHYCGNRSCVNPRHIRWATKVENAADRKVHGTYQWGESNGRAKLTADDVVSIRTEVLTVSRRALARKYGVASSTIDRIVNGKRWSSVQSPAASQAKACAPHSPAFEASDGEGETR